MRKSCMPDHVASKQPWSAAGSSERLALATCQTEASPKELQAWFELLKK